MNPSRILGKGRKLDRSHFSLDPKKVGTEIFTLYNLLFICSFISYYTFILLRSDPVSTSS